MANHEHLAVLRQGAEAWNKFVEEQRASNQDWWADLGEAHLSGADLFLANLSSRPIATPDRVGRPCGETRRQCPTTPGQAGDRRRSLANAQRGDGAVRGVGRFSCSELRSVRKPMSRQNSADDLDLMRVRSDRSADHARTAARGARREDRKTRLEEKMPQARWVLRGSRSYPII